MRISPFLALVLCCAVGSIAGAAETSASLRERIRGPFPFSIELPRTTRVMRAEDFGLSPDKEGAANQTAMERALDACRSAPGATLVVSKGTYRIGAYREGKERELSGQVAIENLTDFALDGGGSTFVFNALSAFLRVSNATRVQVANLTLEWNHENEPVQTLVKAVEVDPAGNWMTITWPLERKARFPFAKGPDGKPRWFKEILQTDPSDHRLVVDPVGIIGGWVFDEKRCELVEENLVRLVVDQPRKYVGPNFLSRMGFRAGQTFVMRHHAYTAPGVSIGDASHLSFSNLVIRTTLGHGVVAGGDLHHWQITDSRLERSPDRAYGFSSGADGFHCGRSKGFFRFERNLWAHSGDDLVNYYNLFTRGVKSTEGNSLVRMNAVEWRNPVKVGETVEIRHPGFTVTGWTSRVRSVEYLKDGLCRIETSDAPPVGLDETTVLFYPEWNPDQFVIRDNVFRDNRGNGILCGAGNGLVENNRFERNLYTAIAGGCVTGRWSEGGPVSNVIIRGNVVIAPDRAGRWKGETPAAFNLSARTPDGFSPYPMIRDILFENNRVEGMPAGGFFLGGAEGALLIRNHVLAPVTAKGAEALRAIFVGSSARGVILRDNRVDADEMVANFVTRDSASEVKVEEP